MKPVFQTDALTTIAHCPRDHKRLVTFDAQGLRAWCKLCKTEWMVTYQEIQWIEQGFALRAREEQPR